MARAAVVAGVVVCVVLGVVYAVPWLRGIKDVIDTVPQPSGITSIALVDVPPNAQACMDRVTMTPRSRQARIRVGTYERPGIPLTFSIRGAGADQRHRVARGAYADNATLTLALRPPARDGLVTVCVRNDGRRKLALYGTQDRALTRSRTFLGAERIPSNFELFFAEGELRTRARLLPRAVERLDLLRPLGEPWVLWPLLAAFVAGVPLLTLLALARSLRSEPPQAGDEPVEERPGEPLRDPVAPRGAQLPEPR